MKINKDVKKLYQKFIQWSSRPDKFTIYLQKNYGTWVDINSFSNVLEHEAVSDFVTYKKLIKDTTTKIYNQVVEEYGEIFDVADVKNLKEITENVVSTLKTEKGKDIVRIVIGV